MKEEQLIFIVSQPRAGSTYLQNVLSNNTFINTMSEHWLLLHFSNQLQPDLSVSEFDSKLANDAFTTYLENVGSTNYQKTFKEFILKLYGMSAPDKIYVLDKTPRYYEVLDAIQELFPKAKIILLKRNPIDVMKSIINTWEVTSINKLEQYKRDLLLAPYALNNFENKHRLNPNVYTLKYEDFISNRVVECEKLYKWIGIPFDQDVLNVDGNHKIKGKYGDPYQAGSDTYKASKKKAKDLITGNEDVISLIEDYKKFLGKDFLENYGGYHSEVRKSKDFHFPHFFKITAIPDQISTLENELAHLKSSTSFKSVSYIASLLNSIKNKLRGNS